MSNEKYTSIVKLDFQYAHRFMNYPCEAKHLHGHSGLVTIEIEDTVDPVTGFARACKEGFKKAWEVCDNFHHATILQEGDPLLEPLLEVCKKANIVNDPEHCVPLKKIDHPLLWSYPEYRICVSKKVTTCENWCEILYELLKDKMPIKKITFRSSSMNCASKVFK